MNQESKKITLISSVGGVIVVALLGFGVFKYMEVGDQEKRALNYKSQIESLGAEGIADAENAQEALEKLNAMEKDYSQLISQISERILKFAPASLPEEAPDAFMANIRKQTQEFKTNAEAKKVKLPGNFMMGFESYSSTPPLKKATGVLSYEFGAIKWLLNEAVQANCSEVVSISRSQIQEEKAQVEEKKGQKQNAKFISELPVEVTLRGTGGSVSKILLAIANSKEYWFRIKGLRIGNEKTTSPLVKDIKFSAASEGQSTAMPGFEDIEAKGKANDSALKSAEKQLVQIVGNEKVTIHLALDLILLDSSAMKTSKTAQNR